MRSKKARLYNNSCIHTKATRLGGPVAFLFVYFFCYARNSCISPGCPPDRRPNAEVNGTVLHRFRRVAPGSAHAVLSIRLLLAVCVRPDRGRDGEPPGVHTATRLHSPRLRRQKRPFGVLVSRKRNKKKIRVYIDTTGQTALSRLFTT